MSALLADVTGLWREIRAHAALSVDGVVDRLVAAAFTTAVSILALAGLLAVIVVGGWFVVSGVAGGLEALVGSRWLGQLLAGLLASAAPAGVLWMWSAARRRARLARLARRYRYLAEAGVPGGAGDAAAA